MADITPEQQEQEEFEFRARAEEEARLKAAEASNTQQPATAAAPGAGPVNPEEVSTMGKVAGGLETAYNLGNEFISTPVGKLAAEAAGIGYGGNRLVKAASKIGEAMRGPVAPPTAPIPTPTPTAPIPTPAAAAQQPGMLSRAGQVFNRYAPALAEGASSVAKTAAKIGGVDATMATYHGGTNEGEQQQIAMAKQWQNNFARLPVAQQTAYYNLPRDKQTQVNAMIMSGKDPSGILSQNNAITSGYAKELNNLGR